MNNFKKGAIIFGIEKLKKLIYGPVRFLGETDNGYYVVSQFDEGEDLSRIGLQDENFTIINSIKTFLIKKDDCNWMNIPESIYSLLKSNVSKEKKIKGLKASLPEGFNPAILDDDLDDLTPLKKAIPTSLSSPPAGLDKFGQGRNAGTVG